MFVTQNKVNDPHLTALFQHWTFTNLVTCKADHILLLNDHRLHFMEVPDPLWFYEADIIIIFK